MDVICRCFAAVRIGVTVFMALCSMDLQIAHLYSLESKEPSGGGDHWALETAHQNLTSEQADRAPDGCTCKRETTCAHFAGRGFESRLRRAILQNSSILIIFV